MIPTDQAIRALKIATPEINYTGVAFATLRYIPTGFRVALQSYGRWDDVLQSAREGAWIASQSKLDFKQTQAIVNRLVYATLKDLGYRKPKYSSRYIHPYSLSDIDSRMHGSVDPQQQEEKILPEEYFAAFFAILKCEELAHIMSLYALGYATIGVATETRLTESQVLSRRRKARQIISSHLATIQSQ